MNNRDYLTSLIHAADPYEGFDHTTRDEDLHGWGSHDPVFERLIGEVRPQRILEIGTWKGASAIHMGGICKKLGLDNTAIVCVDTWLGSVEFWTNHADPDRYQSLKLQNGFPSVYYTFLGNVMRANLQDMIVPFPVTAFIAAEFFQVKDVSFDLIYIDASHEYAEALADIDRFWPLVNEGKVMLGDDFDLNWLGVMRAALEFSDHPNVEFSHVGNKWIYRKRT